jgi:hypothetical protein
LLVDRVNFLIWICAGFWQYRRRCDRAAATLVLLLSRLISWVVFFFDISLVEAPAVKRGVGLAGKGGMVGSRTKLSFGVIRS